MNPNVIKSLCIILIGIVPILVVKFYPVVDWVSEPLFVYFIMLPIILIEVVLFLVLLKGKSINLMLGSQLILTIFLFLIMVYYLKVH